MASLSTKTPKSSSCSSLQAPESIQIASEQKKIKKSKNRKKIRSTLGLNNFLELTDDDHHPVTKSAQKSKTTKRGQWLDFLPSLEGSSQSSRTCTSESDPQDAATSERKLRKATRNLKKSKILLSVSEESAAELDKENVKKARRQSKRKRKIVKQKVIETEESAEDIPKCKSIEEKVNQDKNEDKSISNSILMKNTPKAKRSVVDSPKVSTSSTPSLSKKKSSVIMKNSPKRSIVDSPLRKVKVAAKLNIAPALKDQENNANLMKKNLLKRKKSTPSPMPKINPLGKVNEDEEMFTEEVVDEIEEKCPIKNHKKSSTVVDSPMPKQIAKLSKKNVNETIEEDAKEVKIKEQHIIEVIKNTAMDNLRKNSVVLSNSPKSKKSISVVNSPKPKTSSFANLSKTPAQKNLRKQSNYTPLKSANKTSKQSIIDVTTPKEEISNYTPLKSANKRSKQSIIDVTTSKEEISNYTPLKSANKTSKNSIIGVTTSKIQSPETTEEIKNTTFDISSPLLKDEQAPNFDDDFTFDFTEIGDKKPAKRLSSKTSKISSKSDISVIEISDSCSSNLDEDKDSLTDEVFEASGKLKTELTATSEEIFYDSASKASGNNSDEVFYDTVSQPASIEKEITWPSPRKLRSTFDKEEINQENLTYDKSDNDSISNKRGTSFLSDNNEETVILSPKKKQRTTFDKNSPATNPTPKKKLRSTFDKNEEIAPQNLLADQVFNFELIEPTPIKNQKRSTFEKSPTIPSAEVPHFDTNKKTRKSSLAGKFNQAQSSDILENLNITRRESRKSNFKRKTSSVRYSIGNEDEASKCTNFVTLRRCDAAEVLNQSTPLFGAKNEKVLKEFRKSNLEKSDIKAAKSVKKSILKKCANIDKTDDFRAVFNIPADQLDDLMLDNEKPDLLIDNTAKFSLKPQLLSPERRSSRRRWSQSEKTPIFDKLPENSINKSVRFDDEVPATKKSVKISSPLTTPKGKFTPMLIKKTPKPKFSANDSIISGNSASPIGYMSPPASRSTPMPQNKSLLKKVLTNEKSKAEKMLKNTSSRVKMPNFAKIHERRNEKLESIQDLVERKTQRAKFLMSGVKNLTAAKEEQVEKDSKKKLFVDNENKQKNAQVSKLPVLRVNKMKQKIINKKRASLEKKQKELKSKVTKTPEIHTNVAPQVKKIVSMEKNKAEVGGKVISRFGFKMQTDKVKVTKDEQIKAVCTKSKFIPNTSRTDQNRKNTAEVRTNRRFELLMKMRANKN